MEDGRKGKGAQLEEMTGLIGEAAYACSLQPAVPPSSSNRAAASSLSPIAGCRQQVAAFGDPWPYRYFGPPGQQLVPCGGPPASIVCLLDVGDHHVARLRPLLNPILTCFTLLKALPSPIGVTKSHAVHPNESLSDVRQSATKLPPSLLQLLGASQLMQPSITFPTPPCRQQKAPARQPDPKLTSQCAWRW